MVRHHRSAVLGMAMLAGLATAISACSATPASESAASETPKGEITFWASATGMDAVTEEFNSSQSDIHVTYVPIPNGAGGGYAKLATAIQSGKGPDVAGLEYPQLAAFAANGQIAAIDDYIDEATFDKFPDSAKSLTQFGGHTYGIPTDLAPMIMWWNQSALQGAGVSEPPTTWDEFESAGEKLKAKNPQAFLASFNPNDPASFAAMSWAAGARWFEAEQDKWKVDVNDEPTQKIAARWQDFVDQGIVKVVPSFSDQWSADLADGTLVGAVGASWSAPGIQTRTEAAGGKGQWIASLLPTFDGKPSGAFYGGTAIGVTKDSKNKAAAAVFAQYLGENAAAVAARSANSATVMAYPGLTDVAKETFDSSYFANDIFAVYETALESVKPGWQWGPSWDTANSALVAEFGTVGSGPTIEDALKAVQSTTVTSLEQSGYSVE